MFLGNVLSRIQTNKFLDIESSWNVRGPNLRVSTLKPRMTPSLGATPLSISWLCGPEPWFTNDMITKLSLPLKVINQNF